MKKKRGLGRGLDRLLGDAQAVGGLTGRVRQLSVDILKPNPYQPRKNIEANALKELADSIRDHGVLQPVIVTPLGENRYELVAGERRWRACQMLGLETLPALIRDDLNDQDRLAFALIENIQREDLNPIEEAEAVQRLVNEFSITHQEAAQRLGRSRASISNALRLLKLEDDIKALLIDGKIEQGHARALLGIDKAAKRRALANEIVADKLTVNQVEARVSRLKSKVTQESAASALGKSSRHSAQDADIKKLQRQMSEALGAVVTVRHRNSGGGRIVIGYNSLEELDGVLAVLKIKLK